MTDENLFLECVRSACEDGVITDEEFEVLIAERDSLLSELERLRAGVRSLNGLLELVKSEKSELERGAACFHCGGSGETDGPMDDAGVRPECPACEGTGTLTVAAVRAMGLADIEACNRRQSEWLTRALVAEADLERLRGVEKAARELQNAAAGWVGETGPGLHTNTAKGRAQTVRALAALQAALFPDTEQEQTTND